MQLYNTYCIRIVQSNHTIKVRVKVRVKVKFRVRDKVRVISKQKNRLSKV